LRPKIRIGIEKRASVQECVWRILINCGNHLSCPTSSTTTLLSQAFSSRTRALNRGSNLAQPWCRQPGRGVPGHALSL